MLALADCAREHVGGTAALDLMGGGPAELPEQYRLADPIAAVPVPAPVLCLHSRGDDDVPFSYSERYVAAARAAGGRGLVELSGDHFTLIDPATPDWAEVIAALPGLPTQAATRPYSRERTSHRSGKAERNSVDAQVRRARRAAGTGLRADDPLDHLHVPVAPLLDALVDVDEGLADLGRPSRPPRRRWRAGPAPSASPGHG